MKYMSGQRSQRCVHTPAPAPTISVMTLFYWHAMCWSMLVTSYPLQSKLPEGLSGLIFCFIEWYDFPCSFFVESEIRPARLLTWCQKQTDGYRNVMITDLTSSWQSGLALCALIHRFKPQLMYVSDNISTSLQHCIFPFKIIVINVILFLTYLMQT